MAFWKGMGRLAVGTARVAAKTTVGAAKLAGKGAVAIGKTTYAHREQIGQAAGAMTRVAGTAIGVVGYGAYKATAWAARQVVDHRQAIGGAVVGAARGLGHAAADANAHMYARDAVIEPLVDQIKRQSAEYQRQIRRIYGRLYSTDPRVCRRDVLLDSLVIGGNTLATYSGFLVSVPPEVARAYELAYPDLAAQRTFIEEVRVLDGSQLPGLVSGVKGKLFEIEYVDYLNDGHLPAGYHAALARSATQPGWDIEILGPDGKMREVIQTKAAESVDYVKDALERYPHIDVVTTDEVHGQLVMQGYGDQLISSGISEDSLQSAVQAATDDAALQFSWTPSIVSLALIAFSAYSKEGLDAYTKSKNFGERSAKSYIAYLAGGAVAIATGTWWLGMIGGLGSRLLLGRGHTKRERLKSLGNLVEGNERVLERLRRQPSH